MVQGNTFDEMKYAYETLAKECDMLALPSSGKVDISDRFNFLSRISSDHSVKDRPIHILGGTLPQEGKLLRDVDNIYSHNTGSSSVYASKGEEITEFGTLLRYKDKITDFLKREDISKDLAVKNLENLKELWNG